MLYWDQQEGLVMTSYTEPRFNNDDAAREYLEKVLWPEGTICPHCGVVAHSYPTKRTGVYRCAEAACRKDFTVTMRTVMERSKIALHKWVLAFALYTASKKGFSAHQLHRTLGVTYRSAWFMAHRIRESMRDGGLDVPMGGEGSALRRMKPISALLLRTRFARSQRAAALLQNRVAPARQINALSFPLLNVAATCALFMLL
jgi:transposase-like protein